VTAGEKLDTTAPPGPAAGRAMSIAVFAETFPVATQTFVLNQITGLLEQGVDVTPLAVDPGELRPLPSEYTRHGLDRRTAYLRKPRPDSRRAMRALARLGGIGRALVTPSRGGAVLQSFRAARRSRRDSLLRLPSIVADSGEPRRFDFIVCHFGPGGVLANRLRSLGVLEGPIATVFHGVDVSQHALLEELREDYAELFEQGELFLPISELWKRRLIELGCPEKKIEVQRMGVDLRRFADAEIPTGLGDPVRITTVARFTEKKGLEYAVAAVARVAASHRVRYRIAGSGERFDDIRRLVASSGAHDSIELLGLQPQEKIRELLRDTDICLQPSVTASDGDMEGIPVSLMEAMAMGLLVVSTRHSGIPELIEHRVSGLLAEERDAEGLAELLVEAIRNPRLADGWRRSAREKVEREYSLATLHRQLIGKLARNPGYRARARR
jgi:colanic acid/amylovoran biosynthesis glycosyltransferase